MIEIEVDPAVFDAVANGETDSITLSAPIITLRERGSTRKQLLRCVYAERVGPFVAQHRRLPGGGPHIKFWLKAGERLAACLSSTPAK